MNFSSLSAGILLLAQGGGEPAPSPFGAMLLPMLLIIPLFWFMIIRPEKRKQAEKRALLEGMKKNARVVTAGGIKGLVASVNLSGDAVHRLDRRCTRQQTQVIGN